MTNREEKNCILSDFLRIISHISDNEYQKRIWILNKGPECQAFDDAVCDFFDLGECIFEDYVGYKITHKQQQILNQFRNEFEKFSDDHDFPEEFIDTPEWAKIMDMAKEVLKAFDYKKN